MKKIENESFLQFVERATDAMVARQIGYDEWANVVVGENLYSDETMRRIVNFFVKFLEKLSDEDVKALKGEEILARIEEAKRELEEEKIKVRTINLEFNANKTAEARSKLFQETISEAVARLKPIEFNKPYIKDLPNEAEGVLCIADAHNGVEVDMKTLFGEVVNVYNPDILKARLYKLLSEIVSDKERYLNYGHLTVFDLGDAIQGLLRMSDIAKLKTGVIDSTLDYAEMISQWLTKLSDELQVKIDYVHLGGNHSELRLINGKKGDFDAENMGKVIREFVALRLKDNPNITVAPYSEYGFKNIQGLNILAYHGDGSKDDAQEIAFWENYHQIDIDILIEGHIHHKEEIGVGYALNGGDKEVIHVPSLIGADTFGKKCRKISKAGAKFMLIEDGAKTWERNYILN